MMDTSTWISTLVIFAAALAQTFRNLAQHSLTSDAGAVGAALSRFLYALPFTAVVLVAVNGFAWPAAAWGMHYWGWLVLGALSQALATVLLLLAMGRASYVVAVTFSKTEILQVVLLGAIMLAEWPTVPAMVGMVLALMGVFVMSSRSLRPHEAFGGGAGVCYGLGAGAAFAVAAVAFRAAGLALVDQGLTPFGSAAWSVLFAQLIQSALMVAYLLARNREGLSAVLMTWRPSMTAGAMGMIASVAWFTAYAMRPASEVRALGLIEIVFGYVISRRVLKQSVSRLEVVGLIIVTLGGAMVALTPSSTR